LLCHKEFCLDERFYNKHWAKRYYIDYELRSVKLGDIKVLLYGDIIPLKETAAFKYIEDPIKNRQVYENYLIKHGEIDATTPRPIERYIELQKSIEDNGYNPRNIIILTKDNLLADGQHRACILMHKYGSEYVVTVLTVRLVHKIDIQKALAQKVTRVLINYGGTLGDTLVFLQIIQSLKRIFIDAKIDLYNVRYVKNDSHIQIFENMNIFNHIYLVRLLKQYPMIMKVQRFLWRLFLRYRHYDIGFTIGKRNPEFDKLFFQQISVKNYVILGSPPISESYYDFLREELKRHYPECLIAPIDFKFQLSEKKKVESFLKNKSHAHFIAVCFSGKKASGHWPIERYINILNWLQNQFDFIPVFFDSEDNGKLVCDCIKKLGFGYSAQGEGLTIREKIILMTKCSFYLGNDTGPFHMALAASIPCITLFSATAPFGHWGENRCFSFFRKDLECSGCNESKCRYGYPALCMDKITEDEVKQGIITLLDSINKHDKSCVEQNSFDFEHRLPSEICKEDVNVFLDSLKNHQINEDTDFIFETIKPFYFHTLLDVGFGSGTLLKKVYNNSNVVLYGIEKSEELYNRAVSFLPYAKLYCCDLFLFDEHITVDAVVFSFVLHHLDDPFRALRKFIRNLTPNGFFIIVDRIALSTKDKEDFPIFWEKKYRLQHEWKENCPNIYTRDDFLSFFYKEGFVCDFYVFPHDKKEGTSGFPKTLFLARRKNDEIQRY
jgi:ADP-heptose:LPS heptosyltransferase/SAM-dependent methyltransferase